jgi:hypothetical protein
MTMRKLDPEPLRLLALDPGTTTGWAFAKLSRGDKVLLSVRETMEVGQLRGRCEEETTWLVLMDVIGELEPEVVVVEDFVLFPNQKHSPDRSGTAPMRIIFGLDLFLWMATESDERFQSTDRFEEYLLLPTVVKQMPGERSVIGDDDLRRWGLWRTPKQGGGRHAMDALKHLIVRGRKLRKEGLV